MVDLVSIPGPFPFLLPWRHTCSRISGTSVSQRHFQYDRCWSQAKLLVLVSLHRNFFVQALVEDPDDPIRSQYAPSFLATVRAAKNIIQKVSEQFHLQRVMVSRFWTIWTYTFSATVCTGVKDAQGAPSHIIIFQVVFAFIASRAPRSPLANDAMTELDRGCSLIGEAAKDNRRAAKAFVRRIIIRMNVTAHPLDRSACPTNHRLSSIA